MDELRIVRGQPDDEELAALVAVLCAVLSRHGRRAGERAADPTTRRSAAWARGDDYRSAPGAWITRGEYPLS